MQYKILFSTLTCFLFISLTMAQPKIEFEKTVHDFGVIMEGTIAKHDFIFANTGNQPLVITDVRASCGCTTPTWTSEPILPGHKGKISAGYNSKGRPGAFNKNMTILSNAQNQYVQVFIKGEVKREVENAYSPAQLKTSPRIVLPQPVISIGKVGKGQKVPINITVSNEGMGDLRIDGIRSLCNCISWSRTLGMAVKKGENLTLSLIYSPVTVGEKKEEVIIYSNDLINSQFKFEVLAEVVEDLESQSIIKQNNVLKF